MFAVPAGLPENVAARGVDHPSHDEEQIGEPVEVGERERIHPAGSVVRTRLLSRTVHGRPAGPFGPPDDGPGHVQLRRRERAARQDEGAQVGQWVAEAVAGGLEPGHVRRRDAQRLALRLGDHRSGQICTEVEQLVLDQAQQISDVGRHLGRGERDPDERVGFVDITVSLDPRVGLAGLGHVGQPGLPAVPGLGVDAGEVDHAPNPTHRRLSGASGSGPDCARWQGGGVRVDADGSADGSRWRR